MDDDPTPLPVTPRSGGTVEPLNRAGVAKERFQTPTAATTGDRYELRDPFAEVTYRANSLKDMVAQAEQLGSTRFTAIDPEGQRTPVIKRNGQWSKDVPQQPAHRAAATSTHESARAAAQETPSMQPIVTAEVQQSTASTAKAERAALVERLEMGLNERYVIKRARLSVGSLQAGHREYRFRGDTSRVAFTESTFRLATETNSPSVARSMVDVAETRNWKALRVSGNEDFRRMVWLEASIRGVKTVGYEALPADLELMQKQRESRRINRVEPAPADNPNPSAAAKTSVRGGGRKAVLAAIEAILVAKGVEAPRREAVMKAATEQLAQRIRAGQAVAVKVFDKTAASHRAVPVARPEPTRQRDRPAPQR